MGNIKKIFLVEMIILMIILSGDIFMVIKENKSKPLLSPLPENILGIMAEGPAVVLSETKIKKAGVWPIVTPEPTPTVVSPKIVVNTLSKDHYTVAVFGDSMEDTMGSNLDYLNSALRKKYPRANISFYNYGIGAQNVNDGKIRLCKNFVYKDRNYQSLCDLKPDVIILGSFAYNPFFPYNRGEHWLALADLIEKMKKITGGVYILAEIAPVKKTFGVGPVGVNWGKETAYLHATHIEEQLINAVGLAKTLGVPLIDAYDGSLNRLTGEGRADLINPGDGIHPSREGHEFMAKLMAEKIVLH